MLLLRGSRAFACDDVFGNPANAIPGGNATASTEPVPTAAPVVPADHDEFWNCDVRAMPYRDGAAHNRRHRTRSGVLPCTT
jgi:hypothetical protein